MRRPPLPHVVREGFNTQFLLLAQYGMRPIITVEELCRDYFSHLTVEKFLRKVSLGEIAIPLMRMEDSQRSVRGVHIVDLAFYIDARRDAALKEYQQLHY
jgi:hypothetical protein